MTPTDKAVAARDDVLSAFGAEQAFGGLSESAVAVHRAVLRRYALDGRPPSVDVLVSETGLAEPEVADGLGELRTRDLVVCTGDEVTGAYPFTQRNTGIRVDCGGGSVHAMCAVDALGAGAMVDASSEIEASCVGCGVAIHVVTNRAGRGLAAATPSRLAVWVGVRAAEGNAADNLCTVIRFACCPEHARAWVESQPPMEGHLLDVHEGLWVGTEIFGEMLSGPPGPRAAGGREG